MIDIKVNKVQLRKNLATRDDNIGDWYPGYEEQLDKNLDTRWDIDRSSEGDEEPSEALYIYCAGSSPEYPSSTVWKIQKSDMSKVGESDSYNGEIYALTEDEDYVYCGGYNEDETHTVWKIRKLDMVKVAESANYGNQINALTEDTDYIYCGGGYNSSNIVWKIRKSDMVKIAESTAYGGEILSLTEDATYVYCGGSIYPGTDGSKVLKIQKSNMATVGESANYGVGIYALTEDENYVYCGGWAEYHGGWIQLSNSKTWKIQKSSMSKVGESATYTGAIFALAEDSNYVYCGGLLETGGVVWKIQKSDMSKVAESANYGMEIYALTGDSDHVYCGGGCYPWYLSKKVWKIRKPDMSTVSESAVYGLIYALVAEI